MSTKRSRLRPLLLLLPFLMALPGCLTCAMWDSLDDTRSQRATAVVLTPVTFAIDAALFAGYVCVESCGHGCRGGPHRCR